MREYLLTLLVAVAATYLLTGVVRVGAVKFGAIAEIRERDAHEVPTPRLGGLAMFGGFAVAMLIASKLPMLSTVFKDSSSGWALFSGATVLIVLGVIDDRWGIDALTKLAGQAFAAGVMVLQGIQMTWIPIPGKGTVALTPGTGAVLSVFIVLVMVNAVNFVDGLDGLAAGMVAIAAVAFFLYAYRLATGGFQLSGAKSGAMIAAITVGVCVGFLMHNWDPAKIFMGDTGSMLLGLLLSAATITLTGQVDPSSIAQQAGGSFATHKFVPALILPLVLPFTCLALPFADMVMAVIRRTRAGMSPFAADKQHLHHRLLQIGHSKRRAVLIMYFWSALIAFCALLVSVTARRRPIVIAAIGFIVFGLVLLLMPRLEQHRDRLLHAYRHRDQPARRPAAAANLTARTAGGTASNGMLGTVNGAVNGTVTGTGNGTGLPPVTPAGTVTPTGGEPAERR